LGALQRDPGVGGVGLRYEGIGYAARVSHPQGAHKIGRHTGEKKVQGRDFRAV